MYGVRSAAGSEVRIFNIRVPEPIDIETEFEVEFTEQEALQYESYIGRQKRVTRRKAKALGKESKAFREASLVAFTR